MDAERNIATVGCDAGGRVVDQFLRERVQAKPADGGAFGRFAVGRFAHPPSGLEENSEAGLGAGAVDVQGVYVPQVGWFDEDADFFVGLSGGRVQHGLAAIEFARW